MHSRAALLWLLGAGRSQGEEAGTFFGSACLTRHTFKLCGLSWLKFQVLRVEAGKTKEIKQPKLTGKWPDDGAPEVFELVDLTSAHP